MSGLEAALLALGLAQSGLLVWLLLRPAPPAAADPQLEARLAERLQELSDAVIDAGHAHSERVERELRAEVQASARGLRQESNAQLVQLQRLLARDGIDEPLARRMIAAQASRQQRLAIADDVLVNDRPLDTLPPQIEALDRLYRHLARAVSGAP